MWQKSSQAELLLHLTILLSNQTRKYTDLTGRHQRYVCLRAAMLMGDWHIANYRKKSNRLMIMIVARLRMMSAHRTTGPITSLKNPICIGIDFCHCHVCCKYERHHRAGQCSTALAAQYCLIEDRWTVCSASRHSTCFRSMHLLLQ